MYVSIDLYRVDHVYSDMSKMASRGTENQSIGFTKPQVGTSQRVKGADYALESIHNLREAIPELWEASEMKSEVGISEKVAVETSVTA